MVIEVTVMVDHGDNGSSDDHSDKRQKEKKDESINVMVDFRPLSRSRHMSCCLKGTPSGQPQFYKQTQHASKPNMGPRRKPQVPPLGHIDLEPPFQILNPVGAAQLFGGFSLQSEDPL